MSRMPDGRGSKEKEEEKQDVGDYSPPQTISPKDITWTAGPTGGRFQLKPRRQLVQILHERALAFDLLPDVLGHLRSKGNTLDPPAGAAGKLAQETLSMAVED